VIEVRSVADVDGTGEPSASGAPEPTAAAVLGNNGTGDSEIGVEVLEYSLMVATL